MHAQKTEINFVIADIDLVLQIIEELLHTTEAFCSEVIRGDLTKFRLAQGRVVIQPFIEGIHLLQCYSIVLLADGVIVIDLFTGHGQGIFG